MEQDGICVQTLPGADTAALMLGSGDVDVSLASLGEVQDKSDTVTVASPSGLMENVVLVETSKGYQFLAQLPVCENSKDGKTELDPNAIGDTERNSNCSTIAIPSSGLELQGRQFIATSLPTSLLGQIQQVGLVDGQGGSLGVFETYCDTSGLNIAGQVLQDSDGLGSKTVTELQLVSPDGITTVVKPATPEGQQEPKRKRGGGWPKGKKRKIVPEVNAPRKPATGYVLFAIDRRQEIKQIHPELPFAEVTKILGQEWSCLSTEEKQKFLDRAEEDKKRYIEEMKTFQESETYQNFLKKRKLTNAENGTGLEGDDSYDTLIDLEESDNIVDLYCKVCNQYFISVHNKKEHMFGRQHLQAITGELQKEIQRQTDEQQQQALTAAGLVTSDLSADSLASLSQPDADKIVGPVDIDSFIRGFMQRNSEREKEVCQLQKSVKQSIEDHDSMCKQVKELEEYQSKLEQDLESSRAYGRSLSAQVDTLKMVPTLFGVINF